MYFKVTLIAIKIGMDTDLNRRIAMAKLNKIYVSLVAAQVAILLTGCSAPEQNAPQITVTETVVMTQTADSVVPEQPVPKEKDTPVATATYGAEPTSVPLTLADPDNFRGVTPRNYYFSSPSGNLYCGIFGDETPYLAGCQAQTIVKNLPECNDPMRLSGPMISLIENGGVEANCTSEGVYVDARNKVLEYGQQLTVGTTTCSSLKTGVKCKSENTGGEFLASKNSFTEIR